MSKNNANLKTSLKELLSSDSSRHVFNTLLAVRRLVSKDKNGVADVVSASPSVIPRIVEILEREEPETEHTSTADVVLSILGNMAMDTRARLDISKAGGVKTVAHHFVKSDVTSIQLRSCRTLANLALDTDNIRVIEECDVFPRTIKLLQESTDKHFTVGCCRALRLFGQATTERKKLIAYGAILPLSKQLKKDDKEIVTASLRTLHELSTSGCSYSFAQQVLDANILENIVTLVDDSDVTTSHNALSLLLRLTDIPDVRPSVGAAGGISLFIKLMQEDRSHINKIAVINGLCLCVKEAVNRVKIRELGGLQLFLLSLQDEFYSTVHDRLISGLVCFHYDDASIDILLDNQLVPVLLTHLQRSARFVSVSEKLEIKREGMFTEDQDKILESVPERLEVKREGMITEDEDKLVESVSEILEVKREGMITDDQDKLGVESKSEDFVGGSKSRLFDDSPTDAMEQKHAQHVDDDERKTNTNDNNVFSIDSPTYTINTEWTMGNTSGSISSRQKFTTPLSPQSLTAQYSPLSNESIMSSPSMSSTQYSPPSSPSTTPDIEMYGPIGSKSYMCCSPQPKISPLGWSPPGRDSSDSTSMWHYSSEEEEHGDDEGDRTCPDTEDVECGKKENYEVCDKLNDALFIKQNSEHSASVHSGDSNVSIRKSSNIVDEEMCVKPAAHGVSEHSLDVCVWKGKRTVSVRSPESQKLDLIENIPKKSKTDTKKSDILKTTEKNILILLSRISVKTDPSAFLIVNPVLSCLLDYLTLSSKPQPRCIRTLSRLLRNPHCLEALLRIGAPVFIYKNLLLDENGVDASAYQLFNGKKIKRRSSWSSEGSDSSFSISYDLNLAKYMLIADPQLSSPTRREPETELNICVWGDNSSSQQSLIDLPGMGLNLLKDLSFSAASPFGRGVISHILLRKEKRVQVLCSVCLLYLCWSAGMQRDYLIKMKVVDRMLSLLQTECVGPVFSAVLCGLVFLVKMVDKPPTLKHTVTRDRFKPVSFKPDVSHDRPQKPVSFKPDVSHDRPQKPVSFKPDVSHDRPQKPVSFKPDVSHDRPQKPVSFKPDVSHDRPQKPVSFKPDVSHDTQKPTLTDDSFKSLHSPSNCQYNAAHFDLFFMCEKKRIGSNRETLIRNSYVFSAMLEGHYTEASQSEISIPCTSHDALLYVLHFLHGCDMSCSVILQMECHDADVGVSLDVLALADQYLLSDLLEYVKVVISSRLLTSHSIARVLQFSVFHDFRDLCLDCVKQLFVMPIAVSRKTNIIHELLDTDKASILNETIRQLIGEGTTYS